MKMYEQHEYCKEKEGPRLYKIGMFAALNHVTIKTLRYYDEQGLLKPAYIDKENGYRYYLATQMAELHQILALRNIGFSLDEISQILQDNSDRGFLHSRKQQILKEIAALTSRLAQIESYLSEEHINLSSPVLIKKLPRVTVAAMEIELNSYDDLFSAMPTMGAEMERLGCICAEPDYNFTLYRESDYREEKLTAEICEAVTEKKQDSDIVKFKEMDEVEEAACIFHKGSYNGLISSYELLVKFIEENQYEICGAIRESYIDGIWNKESEDEWLTEIQIPVCRKRDDGLK